MKVLFIGDVVGRPGRRVTAARLAGVRARHQVDLAIVNAENAAAGFGVTRPVADELFAAGADVLTSGNHIWDKREVFDFIDGEPRLLRPQNFPRGTPGNGWCTVTALNGARVGVLNLMGQVFMHPQLDCPFRCADASLAARRAEVDIVVVDFHAEATSEKMAMGWHLDGRVSAVFGSHTHVPTADERVLPRGTAYLSDAGMTGCYDSIIGMDRERVLRRFIDRLPERFEVAEGPASLCGALVEIDDDSTRALSIERIRVDER